MAENLILHPSKNTILLVWKIQEESICRPKCVRKFVRLQVRQAQTPALSLISLEEAGWGRQKWQMSLARLKMC